MKTSARLNRWLLSGALGAMVLPMLAVSAPSDAIDSVDLVEPPPPSLVPDGLSVSENLMQHLLVAPALLPGERMAEQELDRARARGLTVREDGKVLVEIIGPDGADLVGDLDLTKLRKMDVEIDRVLEDEKRLSDGTWMRLESLSVAGDRAEAYIPPERLVEAAEMLPDGYRIQEVLPPDEDAVAGEGPAAVNSDSYRDAGRDGSGRRIGVIDYGYASLTAARNNGDAPSAGNYTLVNYTPDTFEGGGTHGTGCVEAAYDHAPGAYWYIYKINSVSDMNSVVTHAINNGVDVLSHSLSRYNLGWLDNTGTACTEANRASNNGIMFFTSAGNRAQSHWKGAFSDPTGDQWHDFVNGDEAIQVTIPPGVGGNYYLSWSNSSVDLDFYLYNANATSVLASSTSNSNGTFESFYYENTTGSTITANIAVWRDNGSTSNTLEIFSHNANSWNEHIVSSSSTTSPSNCTGGNVISVGAVDEDDYGDANGSNVIQSYSSRGPSNSGNTLPDIAGPTNTTGFVYSGGFGGTSSATPNAAGAATAFWSADANLTASGISYLIKEQADLWRDWGTAGNDNTYGRGGIQLIDYDYGTRWLDIDYPGSTDNGTVPFQTLQAAHDYTPTGGRILVFGDSYPPGAVLGQTGKSMEVQMVPDSGSGNFGD